MITIMYGKLYIRCETVVEAEQLIRALEQKPLAVGWGPPLTQKGATTLTDMWNGNRLHTPT